MFLKQLKHKYTFIHKHTNTHTQQKHQVNKTKVEVVIERNTYIGIFRLNIG